MPITFLSIAEVLEIHQNQIMLYGGEPGLRDLGLLKSALGMPAATYGGEFLHPGIYEMAAAYLFHLVKNHPFVDGNKRVGAVSCLAFLAFNGYSFTATADDFSEMVLAVAAGNLSKANVTIFITRWAIKA